MRLNYSAYLGGVLESYDLDVDISIGKDTVLTLLQPKFV